MWMRIVIGLLLSFLANLLLPKRKPPDPADEISGIPVVNEGDELLFVRGTVWIKNPTVAWWGDMGHVGIKADTSKK